MRTSAVLASFGFTIALLTGATQANAGDPFYRNGQEASAQARVMWFVAIRGTDTVRATWLADDRIMTVNGSPLRTPMPMIGTVIERGPDTCAADPHTCAADPRDQWSEIHAAAVRIA